RRNAGANGDARACRGDRDRRRRLWRRGRLETQQPVRNLSALAAPLSPGHDAQYRARLFAPGSATARGAARAGRTPGARLAGVGRSRAQMLFLVEPAGDRGIATTRRKEKPMNSVRLNSARRLVAVAALATASAIAQVPSPPQSTVSVTASATTTVVNDRLQAWMRAEAENPSAAAAASQVNAAIAKALATAKDYPSVKVATAGY